MSNFSAAFSLDSKQNWTAPCCSDATKKNTGTPSNLKVVKFKIEHSTARMHALISNHAAE
jgi:hypothetical protein